MRVKFVKNRWISDRLAIIYKGNEYAFGKNDAIYIDIDKDDKCIYLKNPLKSFVIFNGLDILLNEICGDGLETVVCCDYSFIINSDEDCEIEIGESKYSIHDNISFKSFYAKSQDAELACDCFYPKSVDKIKKKHRRRCWYILSGLPIYILTLIISAIFDINLWFVYVSALLVFTIPSIRERVRFKKNVKEELISQRLIEAVIGYRTYDDYEERIKTKSEKFFERLANKLFE